MLKGFKIRKNNTNSEVITRYSQKIQDDLDKFPSVITIPVQWGLQVRVMNTKSYYLLIKIYLGC
jgi:hypothetical protein